MIATPFGQFRIFDAHTHFFSHSFYTEVGRQAGFKEDPAAEVARTLNWQPASADPAEIASRWVGEMDRHGVDRMVSIHTLPGDMESAGRGIQASSGRLVGYVMVNPTAKDAPSIVQRAVSDFGFRGLALFPAMFRFSMTSDAAYALLEIAHQHALNVFVHCGVLKIGFRTKLRLPCNFDASFSNPLALQRPCAEFPRANFIIPHLGSGLLRELLMLADMCPNVYADTSGVGGWSKYLDAAPARHQALRQAVDVMGAGRLLFGTDSTFFPRGWRRDIFDEQIQIFRGAKLSEEQVAQILGKNLEGLLPWISHPGGMRNPGS